MWKKQTIFKHWKSRPKPHSFGVVRGYDGYENSEPSKRSSRPPNKWSCKISTSWLNLKRRLRSNRPFSRSKRKLLHLPTCVPRIFSRGELSVKSWAQRGRNFKKMLLLSPIKSNCEVSSTKWRIFSDLGIKFGVNVTKFSIFSFLRGEAILS